MDNETIQVGKSNEHPSNNDETFSRMGDSKREKQENDKRPCDSIQHSDFGDEENQINTKMRLIQSSNENSTPCPTRLVKKSSRSKEAQ